MSCWSGVPGGADSIRHGDVGLEHGSALSSSQPATFFNTDSVLINITSHKADMAAAEILQQEEGKKKEMQNLKPQLHAPVG